MVLSRSLIPLFYTLTLFNDVIGLHNCQNKSDDFFAAQIVLFFTPKTITSPIRGRLSIYYYNPGFKPDDRIALTYKIIGRDQNTTRFYYPTSMKGTILTNVAPTELSYTGESIYKQQCLGYYAHWLRNDTKMTTTCLSTRPDWMFEQMNIIRNHKLISLFIPGTHNSGSYLKADVQSVIEQFTVTQERNITEQLIAGARYFDFRPAIKKVNQPEYWIAHGSYFMNKMDDVLNDIKTFMLNTQEIVIISFKEFPIGFEKKADHLNFIQYLEKKFVGHIYERTRKLWEVTLRDIWKSGTRLLISYDNNNYQKSSKIWPRIPHMWGDIRPSSGLEALRSYLTMADANPTHPRVSMPQFTLNAMTIASHAIADVLGMEHTSLRVLGAIVGHNVTQWYNEIFFRNTSFVAVDYMDATGIVEIAIEWNERRFSTCSDYFFSLMTKN
ncbi:hypothetical protein PV325_005290 [Microctonus aethiopoides]|nr:hypothetical protein PV325_005290 [Microctonus aethiopoides]